MRKFTFIALVFLNSILLGQNYSFNWAKSHLTVNGTSQSFASVKDNQGNIYEVGIVTGTYIDMSPPNANYVYQFSSSQHAYIAKYNNIGNLIWVNVIDSTNNAGYSKALDVELDLVGNVIIAGDYFGSVDFDNSTNNQVLNSISGGKDIFVSKFNTSGSLIWAKSIGGQSGEGLGGLKVANNGDIYLSGEFNGVCDFDPTISTFTLNTYNGGLGDSFLARYDLNMNLKWVKSFGSVYQESNLGLAINNKQVIVFGIFKGVVDFDPSINTYTLSGNSFANNGYVAKYDTSGAFLWANKFGGDNSIAVDGVLLNSGKSFITGNIGSMIVGYDNNGLNTWSLTTNGGNGNCIGIAQNGEITLCGECDNNVDLDPSSNTFTYNTNGLIPFIAKYDTIGQYKNSILIGDDNTKVNDVNLKDGEVYVCGTVLATINETIVNYTDIDPTSNTFTLMTALNSDNPFIMKLNDNTVGVIESEREELIVNAYPNPHANEFYINFEENDYELINQLGQIEKVGSLINGLNKISTKGLSNGIYFLILKNSKSKPIKIIKSLE